MGNRTDAQVIVVGGGPVGMLVAAELAGRGVDTLVLETRATVSERPKATTLHARTAQCLARRGYDVEATLCDQGPDAPAGEVTMPFHFAGMPGLSITAPATEPRPILKVPQARLERMFEARAREEGVHILREHTVTGLVQDDDGVRVDVEGPGGGAARTRRPTRWAPTARVARSAHGRGSSRTRSRRPSRRSWDWCASGTGTPFRWDGTAPPGDGSSPRTVPTA